MSKILKIGVPVIIVLILGIGLYVFRDKVFNKTATNNQSQENNKTETEKDEVAKKWQEGGAAIAGNFADAEIVELGGGKYRIYYSIEPEVAGNKLEVYSATTTDGKTWTKEGGVRRTFSTFPDIYKLEDGSFRMNFQNAGVIKSAISKDGLTWTEEAGVRINGTEAGYEIENVAAPTTTKLEDGTYLMLYSGRTNKKYSPEVPNNSSANFFYATSPDGLTWTKKGLAYSSDNKTTQGWIDGPEFVKWEDGTLRLYFWSYGGVYHIEYKDSAFTSELVFDYTTGSDKNVKFAPNPPGDPTFAKINDTWFMFYGQHEKGIYYVEYK